MMASWFRRFMSEIPHREEKVQFFMPRESDPGLVKTCGDFSIFDFNILAYANWPSNSTQNRVWGNPVGGSNPLARTMIFQMRV